MESHVDHYAFVGVANAYYSRVRAELFHVDPSANVCQRYLQQNARGSACVTVTCHDLNSDDNQLNLRSTANITQVCDQPVVDTQRVLDVTYVTQTSYLHFPLNDL